MVTSLPSTYLYLNINSPLAQYHVHNLQLSRLSLGRPSVPFILAYHSIFDNLPRIESFAKMASGDCSMLASQMLKLPPKLHLSIASHLDLLSVKHLRLVHSYLASSISKEELEKQLNLRKSCFEDLIVTKYEKCLTRNRCSYLCQSCYTLKSRSDFYVKKGFSSEAHSYTTNRDNEVIIYFVNSPCMLCQMAKLGDPRELIVCAPKQCGLVYTTVPIKWGTCNLCRKVAKLETGDACARCESSITLLRGDDRIDSNVKVPPQISVQKAQSSQDTEQVQSPTSEPRTMPRNKFRAAIAKQCRKIKTAMIRLFQKTILRFGTTRPTIRGSAV